MDSLESLLAAYDYPLPDAAIARTPASPRDAARLLVYDRRRGERTIDVFRNIGRYLPPRSVIVINETGVLPVRMQLRKASGGAVEALYLHDEGDDAIRVVASGRLHESQELHWIDGKAFRVRERTEKEAVLVPLFPRGNLPALLHTHGSTPLPPYISDSPLSENERRTEYQTVFARHAGSAAAPTAGLHCTQALLSELEQAGHTIARVTLHVGLGTFAPLQASHIRDNALHTERYVVEPDTAQLLRDARREHRSIIAVGTTSARTVETLFRNSSALSGATDIFLHEDNPPLYIDGLITNFHVPKSSLMMLVAALTGRETLIDLYSYALKERMRFLSFGDAMLIL